MSSLERFILAVAALSLALFVGCKTSEKQPQPPPPAAPASAAPVAVPSAHAHTNAPRLPPDSGDNMASNILAWDATEKTYDVPPGQMLASFTFSLTNMSSAPVLIYDTSTTCDCTVASLPSRPWVVQSGAAGEIHATIDLHRKTGSVTNDVIVFTSQGNRRLTLKAIVPEAGAR